MAKSRIYRKYIAIPQDHGSWVFILCPLMIGIFAGGAFTGATFSLIVAVLAAFMIRQPATILIKIHSNRRSRDDLASAWFWFILYSTITLMGLIALWIKGFGIIFYLAVPGVIVFSWHLWLVSRREERRQINIEVIATGVLSLAAPAAYWVGVRDYDSTGWWLWVLTWIQSAASIVYAYLRLEQRDQVEGPVRSERRKLGRRAVFYTSFNLGSVLLLGLFSILPRLLFIPYLIQWIETMWGISHPAIGWKPTQIGLRQLIVSTLWTIFFILFWRYPWII